jgi:hypothetical protein
MVTTFGSPAWTEVWVDRGAPNLGYNAKFVTQRPMVVNGTKDPRREFSVLVRRAAVYCRPAAAKMPVEVKKLPDALWPSLPCSETGSRISASLVVEA